MIAKESLQGIRDLETLFAFLRDSLKWPVQEEDTFTYDIPWPDAWDEADVSQIVPSTKTTPSSSSWPNSRRRCAGPTARDPAGNPWRMRKEAAFGDKSLADIVLSAPPGLTRASGLPISRNRRSASRG